MFVKAEHTEKEPKEEEKTPPKFVRRFERVVTLPEVVVPEKAEALYRNGMLEIKLPRTEEARPRLIPVHA